MTIVKVPAAWKPMLIKTCCPEFEEWFRYSNGVLQTRTYTGQTPVTFCPFCGRRLERTDVV